MNFATALPFLGVLLSFALLPGLAPRFWHRRMGLVIGLWVVLFLALEGVSDAPGPALLAFWQQGIGEFLPFMALLLALYALGGGIAIKGGPWGRPAGNLLLLGLGTLLASVMGTTGAALLLIHPLLAANGHRREKRHLVLAFIILAGNVGGSLTPLGDPPLLVGFLRGVPFTWPAEKLLLPMLVMVVPILAATYAYDRYLAQREAVPLRSKLRVRGLPNIALLALLVLATPLEGVWHPGNVALPGVTVPGEVVAFTLLCGAIIAVSEAITPRAIRAHNRFAWSAMREITILFFAIYATITPVLGLLQSAGITPDPLLWFWSAGIASAVLDAAPTYLIFFQAAGGNAATLTQAPATLLTAISAGAVFFGPLTYLGNAPNLMIREIASRRGVRMPGFFPYAALMCAALMPLYILESWLFF